MFKLGLCNLYALTFQCEVNCVQNFKNKKKTVNNTKITINPGNTIILLNMFNTGSALAGVDSEFLERGSDVGVHFADTISKVFLNVP